MSKKTMTINGYVIEYANDHELEVAINALFGAKNGRKGTGAPAPEKVEYTKADGTVIMCTPKQAAHFEELKAKAPERKAKFEAAKAEYEAKHAAYKPSDKLIAAIKADRCAITWKVAKEAYGFVGTKQELKALKAEVFAK